MFFGHAFFDVRSYCSTTTKLRIVYDGLTAKEIASANVWWIQHVQKHHFSTVLEALLQSKKQHSLIRQLDLFLCSDEILRCGGRLRHADLPSTANHPILLPKEHPFTVLVIQDIHQKLQHVGTSHTLNHLRRKYWIPRVVRLSKQYLLNACSADDTTALPSACLTHQIYRQSVLLVLHHLLTPRWITLDHFSVWTENRKERFG